MHVTDSSSLELLRTFADVFRKQSSETFMKLVYPEHKRDDIEFDSLLFNRLHLDLNQTGQSTYDDPKIAMNHQGNYALLNNFNSTDYGNLSRVIDALYKWAESLKSGFRNICNPWTKPGKELTLTDVQITNKGETLSLSADDGKWNCEIDPETTSLMTNLSTNRTFYDPNGFLAAEVPTLNHPFNLKITFKDPQAFSTLPPGSELSKGQ